MSRSIKRIILIVLDSIGIGEMPDAAKYGDEGAHTFGHIVEANPNLRIPNLSRLGFCNIDGSGAEKFKVENPEGSYGRMAELSNGKDTITGHWEIAGIYTEIPFKTYPEGFPESFIKAYEEAIGTEILGNYAASGTEIIETLGPEHEKTGKPIVYTSADSVFQIAANTDCIPLQRLYEICEIARSMLHGDVSCGRVIARPYIIDQTGKRVRTSERKDYAVSPPSPTLLDKIMDSGQTVYSVGKISDIFNDKGISIAVHTKSNSDGVDKTIEGMKKDFNGLIFTNLVDFDSKYGHRRDPKGYGEAIEEFDSRLPEILKELKNDDVLILCADHGNDPGHTGWDHTREYTPLVVFGKGIKAGKNLGTRESF
ncbi:MAG: phosphopentomutase, partial [Eubacteriales bacterium]|nr:phosphopentomutase [Eubacteriales bacterium]